MTAASETEVAAARRRLTASLAVRAGEDTAVAALTAHARPVRDPTSGADTKGVVFDFGASVTLGIPHLRDDWGTDAARVASSLRAVAEVLRTAEPSDLVRRYPAIAARLVDPDAGHGLPGAEGWLVATRLGEAVRLVLEAVALSGDGDPAVVGRGGVLPLVHRARFLLLTAPTTEPDAWPVNRVFGEAASLTARTEQARTDWALALVNHDEHPALRTIADSAVDADLRRLARPVRRTPPTNADAPAGPPRPPGPGGPAGSPSPPSRQRRTPRDEEEEQFRAWLAREAFLPRFMLVPTWTAIRPPRLAWLVLALLAVVAASPLITLPWAADHPTAVLRAAVVPAAAVYLVVGALAVHRPDTAVLWCLRLPAGAAIGVVALVSVDDDWARGDRRAWLWASVTLTVVTVGYLLTEALGHGVPRGRALAGRVAAVAALGAAHAVAVATLALAVVVPAVKPTLVEAMAGDDRLGPAPSVVLAASVGLAAGVLLQVLWDDRPVTYPLSHLPWRGRTR